MQTFRNCNNPILPIDIHVPDRDGHVMPDGRLYIYGSFDNRDDVFCSEEYHVVSTADLVDWSIFDKAL
ncbi:MAG: xylosidase, partial [Lachnospiraceae bacterium]|nr:xylosidase [Lachnospiraceae bacterium]